MICIKENIIFFEFDVMKFVTHNLLNVELVRMLRVSQLQYVIFLLSVYITYLHSEQKLLSRFKIYQLCNNWFSRSFFKFKFQIFGTLDGTFFMQPTQHKLHFKQVSFLFFTFKKIAFLQKIRKTGMQVYYAPVSNKIQAIFFVYTELCA